MHDVAVLVRDDLHLDVPRAQHEPFEEQRVVAEARGGLPTGARDGVGHVLGTLDDVHALAAAAGARLDEDGETDLARGRDELVVAQAGSGEAGHDGHVERADGCLRRDLVAHRLDGAAAGAEEGDARLLARSRERGVLRQEPVARVHAVGATDAARLDDGGDAEVVRANRGAGVTARNVETVQVDGDVGFAHVQRARVGVGVDGDAADAHAAQRAHDADGDLAAVGDENRCDVALLDVRVGGGGRVRGHLTHIRKTP